MGCGVCSVADLARWEFGRAPNQASREEKLVPTEDRVQARSDLQCRGGRGGGGGIKHREQALQAARDEKLVPTEDRVKIGKSNLRIDPTLNQMEETYQVILDIDVSSFSVSGQMEFRGVNAMVILLIPSSWRLYPLTA
ncbi:hypothetical protein Tco_0883504 [Tanacetum coccineum]